MKIIFVTLALWEDCDDDFGDENLQSWEFLGWALLE